MRNVKLTRTGTKLVIEVDLAQPGQPSSSGKTMVIASTEGNAEVPATRGFKLGLNVFKYPDAHLPQD